MNVSLQSVYKRGNDNGCHLSSSSYSVVAAVQRMPKFLISVHSKRFFKNSQRFLLPEHTKKM